MKKIVFTIGLILCLALPTKVLASSSSITIKCDAVAVEESGTVKCQIEGISTEAINEVDLKIKLGNNLTLGQVVIDEAWQGSVDKDDSGRISLYTDTDKEANKSFLIAKFDVKTNEVTEKIISQVSVENIKLSDSNFNLITDATSNTVNITITDTYIPEEKSDENRLETIKINDVLLTDFDPEKTNYNVEVEQEVTSIKLEGEPKDKNATAIVEGPETLKEGENVFTITVTSASGKEKVYTVTVNRKNKTTPVPEPDDDDKTDDELPENEKTGSYTYILIPILLVSLVAIIIFFKKTELAEK